jgi:hypothetical protein
MKDYEFTYEYLSDIADQYLYKARIYAESVVDAYFKLGIMLGTDLGKHAKNAKIIECREVS